MIDEDEQTITVLRQRRRRNGHTNGHAYNENDRKANGNWGWTRGKANPFGERTPPEAGPESFRPPRPEIGYTPRAAAAPQRAKVPFDPWRFWVALKRRWHWLLIASFALGTLGFIVADRGLKFKAPVHLMRRELNSAFSNNQNDPYQPRDIPDQTLFSFMKSGEILRRVAQRAAQLNPPIIVSLPELSKAIGMSPTPNPDRLILTVAGDEKSQKLVDLANIYAEEVVRYTRELQTAESGDVAAYLKQTIMQVEKELADANEQLVKFSKEEGFINAEKEAETYLKMRADLDVKRETALIELETLGVQIKGLEAELAKSTPTDNKLKEAQEALVELRTKFTDQHPAVIAQIRKIETLEKSAATAVPNVPGVRTMHNSLGNSFYVQLLELRAKQAARQKEVEEFTRMQGETKSRLEGVSEKGLRYGTLKAKAQALEAKRALLNERQSKTTLYVDSAMGYFRVETPASLSDISVKSRYMKIAFVTIAGAMAGLAFAFVLALLCEAADTRIKTKEDVERVTGLPVVAELGDLTKMSAAEQINWAFRTLTILRGKLCRDADDALVCGFISSRHGEGRSTWVNLLVSAASQRGLRVMTVDTRPASEGPRAEQPKPKEEKAEKPAPGANGSAAPSEEQEKETLNANSVLTTPLAVMERMKNPNDEAVLHIPIPGWVWSLERRQQWQSALEQWGELENSVIFIELPPASDPEAILLAEKIPQLVWLTGSGMADVKETTDQLETLRHAHCNIVGAVLNQAPPPAVSHRFARWFAK